MSRPIANSNFELANAFPAAVRGEALIALSHFPEPRIRFSSQVSVRVAAENVLIPTRIYDEPSLIYGYTLTDLQRELVDCLFTRHHSGYTRQACLERIIRSPNIWIPPFVIQLVGEYVIEILQVINNNLSSFNTTCLRTVRSVESGVHRTHGASGHELLERILSTSTLEWPPRLFTRETSTSVFG